MLALARRLPESIQALKQGNSVTREDLMGTELSGQTLGLVGLGHIGTRVLKLGTAFGMKVLACDPYIDKKEILARGAQPVSLVELVARSEEHPSALQSLMRISYAFLWLTNTQTQ